VREKDGFGAGRIFQISDGNAALKKADPQHPNEPPGQIKVPDPLAPLKRSGSSRECFSRPEILRSLRTISAIAVQRRRGNANLR
jgi:hypothetical protein